MITENFNSSTIRGHYYNTRQQAASFLMTIGAKALVIEEQMSQYEHGQGSNSSTTSMDEGSSLDHVDRMSSNSTLSAQRFSIERQRGMIEEAEFRQKMIQQERIRSIRRRILEKGTLLVYKRGRNNKMRLIEITIIHESKKETYIVWKSKLNRIKRVDIDHSTQVVMLPSERFEIEPTIAASAPPSPAHHSMPMRTASLTTTTTTTSASMSYSTSQTHVHRHHSLTTTTTSTTTSSMNAHKPRPPLIITSSSDRINNSTPPPSPLSNMPFVRFTAKHRHLDLQFQNQMELEAFLLVLQKFTNFNLQVESLPLSPLTNLNLSS